MGVLGKLTTQDVIQIDDRDGDPLPAQHLGRCDPSCPGDHRPVTAGDHRMQQADLVHAGGERGNVAEVDAEALAQLDAGDGDSRGGVAGNLAAGF